MHVKLCNPGRLSPTANVLAPARCNIPWKNAATSQQVFCQLKETHRNQSESYFFKIEQEGLVGIIYIDIRSIVKHIISIAITDEGKANWP